MEYLINFDKIDWEIPQVGVKQKVYLSGDHQLRLIQFDDDFIENEWCLKGHAGYVLEGEMKIKFQGIIKNFKMGDGLLIPFGKKSKHKVLIDKGKLVKLILFESIM